jgi:hypothetical protein
VSIAGLPENSQLRLMSMTGALVWEGQNLESPLVEIPLERLPAGLYQLVVENQGSYGYYKLVKQ